MQIELVLGCFAMISTFLLLVFVNVCSLTSIVVIVVIFFMVMLVIRFLEMGWVLQLY